VDKVFVVDDGSSDRTAVLAQEGGAEVIRHPVRRGVGAALQSGYRAATAQGFDVVVQLDADGQHDPRYIPAMLDCVRDADMVIGSRFLNESHAEYSLVRRAGIWFFTWVVNRLTSAGVTDITSGYRAFRAASLGRLTHAPDGHWAVEQTVEAARKGLVIREVSVPMPVRRSGKSQFTLRRYALYPFRMIGAIARGMQSGERRPAKAAGIPGRGAGTPARR